MTNLKLNHHRFHAAQFYLNAFRFYSREAEKSASQSEMFAKEFFEHLFLSFFRLCCVITKVPTVQNGSGGSISNSSKQTKKETNFQQRWNKKLTESWQPAQCETANGSSTYKWNVDVCVRVRVWALNKKSFMGQLQQFNKFLLWFW